MHTSPLVAQRHLGQRSTQSQPSPTTITLAIIFVEQQLWPYCARSTLDKKSLVVIVVLLKIKLLEELSYSEACSALSISTMASLWHLSFSKWYSELQLLIYIPNQSQRLRTMVSMLFRDIQDLKGRVCQCTMIIFISADKKLRRLHLIQILIHPNSKLISEYKGRSAHNTTQLRSMHLINDVQLRIERLPMLDTHMLW